MKNLITKSIIAIVAFFSFAVAGSQVTSAHAASTDASYSTVLTTAKQKLGHPYVWGATGPYAFDCSGFTGYVYKKAANITIPRTAQAQYNAYKHVSALTFKKVIWSSLVTAPTVLATLACTLVTAKWSMPKTAVLLLNAFTHHGGTLLVTHTLLTSVHQPLLLKINLHIYK